jgi:Xaa-Pro aminopeptidase
MDHAARVDRLLADLVRPLLVSSLTNIRYLTGFSGSNASLVASPAGLTFLTDGRYGEVAEGIVAGLPSASLTVYSADLPRHLAAAFGEAQVVEVEAAHVTWDFVRKLSEQTDATLEPATNMIERYRRVKDDIEVAALRSAAAAGDAAFDGIGALVANEHTEGAVGDGLIAAMKAAGAERAGWEPIVAVGPNAARPHHRAGTGAIDDEGLLLVDYGCVVDGYHSDMTRTVWLGNGGDPEVERVYEAVLAANQAGIDAVGPGVAAGDVDEVCRDVLRTHGYEEHFVHSTGHGVGLEIHEAPWVRKNSTDILQAGNVVTIEPGVYLPERFGVRIEDMVLVTESGAEVLTGSSKELRLR